MKAFTATLISLSLIAALAAGTTLKIDGLVTVSVAVTWVLCLIGLVVAIIMMASASSYSMVDGKAKEKVGALLTDAAKTKSLARKLFGWTTFMLTVGLLAWSGWVVTAVVYGLSSLIIRLARSMARDEAVKQGLA